MFFFVDVFPQQNPQKIFYKQLSDLFINFSKFSSVFKFESLYVPSI